MEIKQSNPNWSKEFDLKLKELDGYETSVGWFDTAKYKNGTPVAGVAAIQELGNGKIPPRPFMRPAEIKSNGWKDTAAFAAKKVLDGSFTGKQAMDYIGTVAEGDILEEIVNITQPPLSKITLGIRKLKQQDPTLIVTGATVGRVAAQLAAGTLDVSGVSTKPLNDTGHMIATLTHITSSTK